MKYSSGEVVNLGDKVTLGDGAAGEVVCSLDTGEFSPLYPQTAWAYLKSGVLINFPKHGLIHYLAAEPDLQFRGRAPSRIEK